MTTEMRAALQSAVADALRPSAALLYSTVLIPQLLCRPSATSLPSLSSFSSLSLSSLSAVPHPLLLLLSLSSFSVPALCPSPPSRSLSPLFSSSSFRSTPDEYLSSEKRKNEPDNQPRKRQAQVAAANEPQPQVPVAPLLQASKRAMNEEEDTEDTEEEDNNRTEKKQAEEKEEAEKEAEEKEKKKEGKKERKKERRRKKERKKERIQE